MSEVLLTPIGVDDDFCRSVGVRPYIPGDELLGYYEAPPGTNIAYTVPENKIFLLKNFSMANTRASANEGAYIYDLTPSVVYLLGFVMNGTAVEKPFYSVSINDFIEISSGYSLRVSNTHATSNMYFSFHGYLIDV